MRTRPADFLSLSLAGATDFVSKSCIVGMSGVGKRHWLSGTERRYSGMGDNARSATAFPSGYTADRTLRLLGDRLCPSRAVR